MWSYFDGLVHDCSISNVLAMEILQSWTKSLICFKWTCWDMNILSFIRVWWRHGRETISVILALCGGNPLVTDGFPSQRTSNADLWCFLFMSWKSYQANNRIDMSCHSCDNVCWLVPMKYSTDIVIRNSKGMLAPQVAIIYIRTLTTLNFLSCNSLHNATKIELFIT